MLKSFASSKLVLASAGSLAVILVLLGLWKIPQWQVAPIEQQIDALKTQPKPADPKDIATLEKSRIDAENTSRTVLVQGIGGFFIFVTASVAYLNFRETRRNVNATERNVRATEEKQIAERFSKAVELLGSANIHAQLGGVYSLEQIAKDAEEKYYWQVLETLTSYVRVKSPYPPKTVEQTDSIETPKEIQPLATEIQAVMTVLARRKHHYGHPLEPYCLNFRSVDLRNLELPFNANLQGVDFCRANLQGALLNKANLQGALLKKANLQGAYMKEANLQRADFSNANLQKVSLVNAQLQGAVFLAADLQGAHLEMAAMQGADFLAATLQGADLEMAAMQGANFSNANLQGASLGAADLQGAHFRDANLQGAHLSTTKLQAANLENADLQGAFLCLANLQGAFLKNANLQGAKFKRSEPEVVSHLGTQEAVGLTWEQINQAETYTKELLPDYLLQQIPELSTEAAEAVNPAMSALASPRHEAKVGQKGESAAS